MKTTITISAPNVSRQIEVEGDCEQVLAVLEALGQIEDEDVQYVPENNTIQ